MQLFVAQKGRGIITFCLIIKHWTEPGPNWKITCREKQIGRCTCVLQILTSKKIDSNFHLLLRKNC